MSAPENPGDPDETGRPDFTYETRNEAVKKAREKGGEWRVNKKKIDGNQHFVVERKTDRYSSGGADVEVWRDDR